MKPWILPSRENRLNTPEHSAKNNEVISEPVVIALKRSLNIEETCVKYLRKTKVSENILKIYPQKTCPKDIGIFFKESQRNKNIMTSTKTELFCKKYNINLGVYNKGQRSILPKPIKERRTCLYNHKKHFCLIWKMINTTFTDAIKEIEDNFEYEASHISDNISKQIAEYKFPTSNEKDCLYAVLSFDPETVNLSYQKFCEAYAADCCHINRLKEGYNGDLTDEELEAERQHVHILDRVNYNPVLDMI